MGITQYVLLLKEEVLMVNRLGDVLTLPGPFLAKGYFHW